MVESQKELFGLPIGEMAAVGLVVLAGVVLSIRGLYSKVKSGLEKRIYGDPNEMMSVGPTGPANSGNHR